MWRQKEVRLAAKRRGFHLVTDEVMQNLPELINVQVGLLNLFIQLFVMCKVNFQEFSPSLLGVINI